MGTTINSWGQVLDNIARYVKLFVPGLGSMADSPQAAEIWKWFSKVYSVEKRLHETHCRCHLTPFGISREWRCGEECAGMGEARLMP